MIFGGFSIGWLEDFTLINDRVFLIVDLPVSRLSMGLDGVLLRPVSVCGVFGGCDFCGC
jgi:hypothetical protein